MHIFEKKFLNITIEDMLFKLCTYHQNHEGGINADFDIEDFLNKYNGDIKKFHKTAPISMKCLDGVSPCKPRGRECMYCGG